jgi:hypothetical protein
VFIVYFVSDGYLNDARLFRNNIINMKELFDAYSIIVNAIFLGNYGDTKKRLLLYSSIYISSIKNLWIYCM